MTRRYRREAKPRWPENLCAEDNQHVQIGADSCLISSDDHLMPIRKDQPPPDLRRFGAPK